MLSYIIIDVHKTINYNRKLTHRLKKEPDTKTTGITLRGYEY